MITGIQNFNVNFGAQFKFADDLDKAVKQKLQNDGKLKARVRNLPHDTIEIRNAGVNKKGYNIAIMNDGRTTEKIYVDKSKNIAAAIFEMKK